MFGDKGYVHDKLKRAARKAGVFWGVALKASSKYKLTASNRRFNRKMASVRSRVEHLFRMIKRPFGYTKVRYRALCVRLVVASIGSENRGRSGEDTDGEIRTSDEGPGAGEATAPGERGDR